MATRGARAKACATRASCSTRQTRSRGLSRHRFCRSAARKATTSWVGPGLGLGLARRARTKAWVRKVGSQGLAARWARASALMASSSACRAAIRSAVASAASSRALRFASSRRARRSALRSRLRSDGDD
eukprot:scaffold88044_cov75-Phaeocystis_antarctica.AAC.4